MDILAARQLMAPVDAFSGLARPHDDVTCMVLRTFNAGESTGTKAD